MYPDSMQKIAPHRYGRASGACRLLIRVVALYFVLAQIYRFLPDSFNTHTHKEVSEPQRKSSEDASCSAVAKSPDNQLVIMVKTGTSEAAEKVPVQLDHSLRCWPFSRTIWFSDLEEEIDGHHLIDALDAIPEAIKAGNPDFDIYRRQQERAKGTQKVMELPDDTNDANIDVGQAAWTLDKYKFVHLVEKTWNLKPEADWYLLVDADTYIVLPSLLAWLPRLDSARRLLLGSVACFSGRPFGHGGSGILMSKAAVYDLVVANKGTASRWDARIHENCCGDSVLADAFKENGVDVMNSWPVLNGETPFTIRFSAWNWCQPLVTMHHITTDAAQQLASFERRRKDPEAPLRYHELFTDFISDMIPESRENWDNMSNGVVVPGIVSAPDCIGACQDNPSCLQSLWKGDLCSLGTDKIVLGEAHERGEGDKTWHSTWNKTRIWRWVSEQAKCSDVFFPYEDGVSSISAGTRCA
ncbi:hypothetical protein QTJ16_007005 [Diplocarpon rosae]|uniref:Glycosyltransferase family 31 protein n=1 Tax=Diplocarpon rosae TaxID=946125 RepID=A0AAD9WCH9_9HELO|nr:hypothetical protein QTJ16_007005 [Diplocarpon rosae]PBP26331.1 hypothetical protein BUE80_DR002647 [Diplocarpon rosae]